MKDLVDYNILNYRKNDHFIVIKLLPVRKDIGFVKIFILHLYFNKNVISKKPFKSI